MKKTYTRRQIAETIKHWEMVLESMNENDHKWNSSIEKILSGFQPKIHEIEGVSLAEFGTEDPVELAKKLYASLAEKNGLTGTRYVPGGYSHAGFDYHNSLDGDFKLYFNDQPTFTFRHVVLKTRDTEWIPDGNPYDGVCPKTVWRTMADSCAVTVKPGFKMVDLKNVERGMKAVVTWREEFEVRDADYPFYTLKWLFQVPRGLHTWNDDGKRSFDNYLNFVSYEAGPLLTKKLQSLGTIAGRDLVEITSQIVNMPGVKDQLKPGSGETGQTLQQFKSARARHLQVLKQKLDQKKNAAAARAKIEELRNLIDGGITYEELFKREDFPSIVTAVITSSRGEYGWRSPSAVDYHQVFCTDELDVDLYSNQRFDEDGYNEAFFEIMDEDIEESMIGDDEDSPVVYEEFENAMIAALKDAQKVDVNDYIEEIEEEPDRDWYD